MSCEKPLIIPNPRYKDWSAGDKKKYALDYFGVDLLLDEYIQVPCGYCHSCTKKRMRDYRIRLLYEYNKHPDSIFITLTFNDSALQEYGSNTNKAVCQFLDAFRKRYGKEIRHWIVPEFGSLHGRIHYHGILFGVKDYQDFTLDMVEKIWNRERKTKKGKIIRKERGFVWIGWCNEATVNYIVKYITKDDNTRKIVTPRIISSKGLGISYLDDPQIHFNGTEYQPFIEINGYKYGIPRYYSDKLFTRQDKANMLYDRFQKPFESFVNGRKYFDSVTYKRALSLYHSDMVKLGLSPKKRPATRKNKRRSPLLSNSITKNYEQLWH